MNRVQTIDNAICSFRLFNRQVNSKRQTMDVSSRRTHISNTHTHISAHQYSYGVPLGGSTQFMINKYLSFPIVAHENRKLAFEHTTSTNCVADDIIFRPLWLCVKTIRNSNTMQETFGTISGRSESINKQLLQDALACPQLMRGYAGMFGCST